MRELAALKNVRVVIALGKFAFDAYLAAVAAQGHTIRKGDYRFAHLAEYTMPHEIKLLASYHPSNQNTATGKLTEAMFEQVFARARQLVETRIGKL